MTSDGIYGEMRRFGGGWSVSIHFPGPPGDEWLSSEWSGWCLTRWGARGWIKRGLRQARRPAHIERIWPSE